VNIYATTGTKALKASPVLNSPPFKVFTLLQYRVSASQVL